MTHSDDSAPSSSLTDELSNVICAGDALAEAAHRVQAEHDGIHRLRLALANWYRVRACEFGRATDSEALERKWLEDTLTQARAFLQAYRDKVPLGHQPHMMADRVDKFLDTSLCGPPTDSGEGE